MTPKPTMRQKAERLLDEIDNCEGRNFKQLQELQLRVLESALQAVRDETRQETLEEAAQHLEKTFHKVNPKRSDEIGYRPGEFYSPFAKEVRTLKGQSRG